jgi:hypothetical protein
MALLTNINGRFAVEDDGAIQFNGSAGSSGYVLESRGANDPPVWTDRDTGNVTGTGTLNKVVRWTATGSTIGDGPITFATNNSTFAGNVGIGITPSASFSGLEVLQLGKGMTIFGNTNDDRATMAANLIVNTGTAFEYVMDGLAGRFSIEDGNMVWGTAPTGSAGGVATVTTRMTLLNTGNVGIGTVLPGDYDGEADNLVVYDAVTPGITIALPQTTAAGSARGSVLFADGTSGSQKYRGGVIYDHGTGMGGVADTMYLRAAVNSYLVLDASGNVGIGTKTPTSPTSVTTFLAIEGTTAGIVLSDNGDAAYKWDIWNSGGGLFMKYNDTTFGVCQSSSGNVGIGTTGPITKLSNTTIRNSSNSGLSTSLDGLNWEVPAGATSQGYIGSFANTQTAAGNYNGGVLIKVGSTDITTRLLSVESNGINRFEVRGDGNVGIGTDSPGALLQVGDTPTASSQQGARIYGYDGALNLYTKRAESPFNAALYLYNNPVGEPGPGTGILFRARTSTTDGQVQATVYSNWTTSTHATRTAKLVFQTCNAGAVSDKMTILGNGKVGIGTTSPGQKLHVNDGSTVTSTDANNMVLLTRNDHSYVMFSCPDEKDSGFHFHNTTDNSFVGRIAYSHESVGDKMFFRVGSVETMTISASNVNVTGTITASGDVVAFSDKKLKKNIKTLDGSKVYNMRGVSFIKDNKKGSGVIAQEMQKIAPELVNDESEYLGVAYGNISGYLIEAIKELKAEIEELKLNKCNCKCK